MGSEMCIRDSTRRVLARISYALSGLAIGLIFTGTKGWWYPEGEWALPFHAGLIVAAGTLAAVTLPRGNIAFLLIGVVWVMATMGVLHLDDEAYYWCGGQPGSWPKGWSVRIDYGEGIVHCRPEVGRPTTITIADLLEQGPQT